MQDVSWPHRFQLTLMARIRAKLAASSLPSVSFEQSRINFSVEVIKSHDAMHRIANLSLDDLISSPAFSEAQEALDILIKHTAMPSSPSNLLELKEQLSTLSESNHLLQALSKRWMLS